jgi:hypothetical protein
MNCLNCGLETDELLSRCVNCGTFTGFPNVRLAQRPEEIEALEDRYVRAVANSISNGTWAIVSEFEDAVRKSSAVVSMSLEVMTLLATSTNALYSNYELAVRAQTRRPAKPLNDQNRSAVDSKFWGVAASEIRYAALSLYGVGLDSYGMCFALVADKFIQHRATVLEENTFPFIERIRFADDLPLGFRSDWSNRHKVAVAKLYGEFSKKTKPGDFARILLNPGTRDSDQFIEVHIYGSFGFAAFSSISTLKPKNKRDKVLAGMIRDYTLAAGKKWVNG